MSCMIRLFIVWNRIMYRLKQFPVFLKRLVSHVNCRKTCAYRIDLDKPSYPHNLITNFPIGTDNLQVLGNLYGI